MASWRRFLVAAVGALSLVGAGTASVGADGRGDRVISFDSMTAVTGSAVGAVNDRGIKGGGLPWVITSGTGSVDRQGDVSVSVKGLIIVVPPVNGHNPVPFFKATVSCITPDGVVNVSTGNFPASPAGDSTIKATVDLPHPCKDPIVFVAAPTGQWFAESNGDD
jgi:hypothetical protein